MHPHENESRSDQELLNSRFFERIDLARIDPEYTGHPLPYYQPIFSFETADVEGYELLARGQKQGGVIVSIGSLFFRPELTDDMKSRLEGALIEDAILQMRLEGVEGKSSLFVNYACDTVQAIQAQKEQESLASLLSFHSFSATNIVIEWDLQSLLRCGENAEAIVQDFRNEGFRISIQSNGEAIDTDFLVRVKPDFIKVDYAKAGNGNSGSDFRDMYVSLTDALEGQDTKILVQRIEFENDLIGVVGAGALFLQGYLLSRPRNTFLTEEFIRELMRTYRSR